MTETVFMKRPLVPVVPCTPPAPATLKMAFILYGFPVYTGLGSDASFSKAGKMPALPGKSAHEMTFYP